MAELLSDIREEDYPQLRRREALSVWHIARAVLDGGCPRLSFSQTSSVTVVIDFGMAIH